ncbi:Gfo/Idh/MocA family protein [Radiobacillus sp. PE A8.2]|uniref:Gfo/Idh/MocA family protein n=1 Tax=Radiobacillus sp. PE A8.2 TaxID=3380349 RepID=UPI00389007D6
MIKYNFEYEKKVKVCFIGAGGHSFRNVYPTFQYAPIDLLAICDMNEDRARDYARQFGARNYYTNHHEMLEKERPDAVFIVTAYTSEGRVQATELAKDIMKAGAHVWMEKPTAASTDEIKQLMSMSEEKNLLVMTGLKKIFFPSIEKVKEIMDTPAFGKPSSIYIRYPQSIPVLEERGDLTKMTGFLDHIFHPGSVLHYLMGPIRDFSYLREPNNGGTVTNIRFTSGAVGTMHMTAGMSKTSPLERLEVIGEGSNVIVENGVKVTYYRELESRNYGRSASYLWDNKSAPLYWEPEFSLGQLYNKNIFYLGYVQEVLHFCEAILEEKPLEKGTLQESLEILKLFEAYCTAEQGTLTTINE